MANFDFKKPQSYLDDLLGVDDTSGKKDISIDLLDEISEQPFKAYGEEQLAALSEDIAVNGLLSPLVVRKLPQSERYEVIAGRNRFNACKRLKMARVPCVVKNDLSEAQRNLILVNSNLMQRQTLLPSERAKAYKMQFDACRVLGIKISLVDSSATAYKYLRLNLLLPELLDMVDSRRIQFAIGYEISGMSEREQRELLDYLNSSPKAKVTKSLLDKQKQGGFAESEESLKTSELSAKKNKAVIKMSLFNNSLRYVDALEFEEFLLEYEGEIARLFRQFEQQKK